METAKLLATRRIMIPAGPAPSVESLDSPTLHAPAPSPRPRLWQTAIQFLIAVVAVVWLVRSGRLDLSLLREQLTWQTLSVWAGLNAVINGLSTVRWYWFCRRAGLAMTARTAIRMMGIGLFWGIFTPGLVGIDISRAYMLARHFPGQTGPGTLTVVADRLMIIIATLLLSALSLPLAWPLAVAHPALLTVSLGTAAAGLGLIGLVMAILFAPLERWALIKRLIDGPLARTYAAIRFFRHDPGLLAKGFGLAMVSQILTIGLIGVLLKSGAGSHLSWATLGLIVPIGWHAMSLPVAPAGLGVGQVAFDQLFVWAGAPAGTGAMAATAYQACLIGFHLLIGLTWLIPDRSAASPAPAP